MNRVPWDAVIDSSMPKLTMAFKVKRGNKAQAHPWCCHPRKLVGHTQPAGVCCGLNDFPRSSGCLNYVIFNGAQQSVE